MTEQSQLYLAGISWFLTPLKEASAPLVGSLLLSQKQPTFSSKTSKTPIALNRNLTQILR